MEIFVLSLIELHTIHYIVWNKSLVLYSRGSLQLFYWETLEVDLWEV